MGNRRRRKGAKKKGSRVREPSIGRRKSPGRSRGLWWVLGDLATWWLGDLTDALVILRSRVTFFCSFHRCYIVTLLHTLLVILSSVVVVVG